MTLTPDERAELDHLRAAFSRDPEASDQVPSREGVERAIAGSHPLITMIRGRVALVIFAESEHVPSPNEIRSQLRALREATAKIS